MWFTEDPWPPILISGLGTLVCLALWNSSRKSVYAVFAFLLLICCGIIFYAEKAIITEGERLQELVVNLCNDFQKKDVAGTKYFSDKAVALKAAYQAAILLVQLEEPARLTDFQTQVTNQNSRATVHFRANATISVTGFGNVGHQPARLLLTLQKENGEWKIIDVERLNPLTGKKMELLDKTAG